MLVTNPTLGTSCVVTVGSRLVWELCTAPRSCLMSFCICQCLLVTRWLPSLCVCLSHWGDWKYRTRKWRTKKSRQRKMRDWNSTD